MASKAVPFQAGPHMLIQVPSGFETLASLPVGPRWISDAPRLLAADPNKTAADNSTAHSVLSRGAIITVVDVELLRGWVGFVQCVFISGSIWGVGIVNIVWKAVGGAIRDVIAGAGHLAFQAGRWHLSLDKQESCSCRTRASINLTVAPRAEIACRLKG